LKEITLISSDLQGLFFGLEEVPTLTIALLNLRIFVPEKVFVLDLQ
jgi:hypothetical protein